MRRLLVVIAVYSLIFGYAQLTAAWLLFPAWRPETPELLALLVGPAAGWLLHQARRNAASRWVQRAVYLWLGLGFLLLVVVVPVHLLRLLGLPEGAAAMLLVCVYAPLAIWSVVNAHRIAVRRVELSSRKLDRPLRLVQVSDVHVGSRGPGFLPRIVRRVGALEPDAVFITGDLVDLMGLPSDALDSVGRLSAPAFFAIGNHERYVGSDAVCARMEALGVTTLRNAAVDRGTLRIVGIDDAEVRDQVARQLARIEVADHRPAAYTVLMYHRPDGAPAAGARRRRPDALRPYPQRPDRALQLDGEALLPLHRGTIRHRGHGAPCLPRHRNLGTDPAPGFRKRDHALRARSGSGRRRRRAALILPGAPGAVRRPRGGSPRTECRMAPGGGYGVS